MKLITGILVLALLCLIGVVYLQNQAEHFSMYIPPSLMNSLSGGDSDYFPRILTSHPPEPDADEITAKFKECITTGETVKGCLTLSGAGMRPGLCMSLCATQYGDLGKWCSTVCADQQNQVNTSARFGPA
jgi:hypothetical protein